MKQRENTSSRPKEGKEKRQIVHGTKEKDTPQEKEEDEGASKPASTRDKAVVAESGGD